MQNKEKQYGYGGNYRKKIMALVLAGALAAGTVFTGCGKQNTDNTGTGEDNTGYTAGNSQDASSGDELSMAGGDSGTLQERYKIPESCNTDIKVGDSGLKKITIEDDEITTPNTGDMYIAHFKKKSVGNAERKQVVESIFGQETSLRRQALLI